MANTGKTVPVILTVGPAHPVHGIWAQPAAGSGDSQFQFNLHRKDAVYGDVAIPHYWMAQSSVYGTRGNARCVHQTLVDCFWACCLADPKPMHDDDLQIYVLALLLPEARNIGSRRVLKDSIPPRMSRAVRDQIIQELDDILAAGTGQSIDEAAFRDQTADAIGPPEYEEALWNRYWSFESDLMGENLLNSGAAGFAESQARWRKWMRGIGRRSGKHKDKKLLDILSYEARAAVHECYSTVWEMLLPKLAEQDDWSDEAERFHHLWHLDQTAPANEGVSAKFHLFHGHIFALHPACGELMRTQTGRQLIGNWLSSEPPKRSASDDRLVRHAQTEAFHQLLNGVSIAVYSYAMRRDVYADLRRKQPRSIGGSGDIDQLQGQQIERDTGRRSPGR